MKSKAEKLFTRRTSNAYHSQKHRASQAGCSLDYSLAEFRQLVSQALESPCPYCEGPLTTKTWQADHAYPVGRASQMKETFSITNIIIVCERCNGAKGPLTRYEYLELIATLVRFPEEASRNVLARLKAGGKIVKGL